LRAIRVDEYHAALEDVGVHVVVGPGGVGARDLKQVAKLAEKEGVVRAFGALISTSDR